MKTLDEVNALLGKLPVGDLPLALFPIQLQTRFVDRDGQPQLLVRVYPDDVHIDGHEEQLTAAEVEWGKRYWELIWPAAGDETAQRQAWEQLAGRFGSRRAAWVARRMTPVNLDQRPAANQPGVSPVFGDPGPLKEDAFTLPAMVRLLPDRWVVMGYLSGKRVLLEVGAPIPDDLPVSLAPDDTPAPPPDVETLPIHEGMRWMVDFTEAERVGMGVRIPLPPDLADGALDLLVVFGVKGAITPQAAADTLEAQLDAQHFTRGLAFIEPGTPTNNTAEAPSGVSRRDTNFESSFQSEVQSLPLRATSDGALTARLLGVRREVFAAVEGANRVHDLSARHMQTALWPVTGGYYLEQILATAQDSSGTATFQELDQARRHFVDFVRQAGPLPALRLGRQPYGLLPVLSLDLLAGTPAGTSRFVRLLRFLRTSWKQALGRIPRVQPGEDGAEDLIEVLRMQPLSVGYRARLAFDSQFFVPKGVVSGALDPSLAAHRDVLSRRLAALADEGLLGEARFFDLIPVQTSTDLNAPLVQPGGEVPGSTLTPNYVRFLRTASFDDILNEHFPADFQVQGELDALLYLMLRHSVLLAYATTAYRILVRRGQLPDAPFHEPALVDIAGTVKPIRARTLLRVLDVDPSLRASIHTLTAAQEPEATALDELRASLLHLEALPLEELSRQFSGCLDLFAYRLDAWITSLATSRLDELRKQRPRGLALGGFGWVENVQPLPRIRVGTPPPGEDSAPLFAARERGGFIHAPSMSQAAAAAVLRSGYLTQPGEDSTRPFAIDLSSERVRLAQWLLDGIRQGQSLDALLGYRFERRLHERGLDQFIDDFRRISLLAEVYLAQDQLREAQALPAGAVKTAQVKAAQAALSDALNRLRQRYLFAPDAEMGALEAVAARNVVNGLALVRLFAAGDLPFGQIAANTSQRAQLEAELRALQAAVDALSDALTAEGVYQAVRGNTARAAASVDAIAHGEIQPPDLQFISTPRPGSALTHRLVTLFSGATPAVPAGTRQFRAKTEPRLNAWVRQMTGELQSVRCLAEFLDDNGQVIGKRQNIALSVLGISHLDAVYLSAAAEPGQPSDLERLVEYYLRRQAPPKVPPSARLRLLHDRPAQGLTPAQLSFGEFLAVLSALRQTILGSRPVDAGDLLQSDGETPSSVDLAELKARVDQAVDSLRQAHSAITAQRDALQNATAPALEQALDGLRERLLDLLSLGFPDGVPLSPKGSSPEDRERLLTQTNALLREGSRRLEQLQALEAGFNRTASDPKQQIQHDLERAQVVFGRVFRLLPLLSPPNRQELAKAFQASDSAQNGDPLQVVSWLQGISRVRVPASRLNSALTYAAALRRRSALELRVAQLPFRPGERWIALPVPPGQTFPPGKLSLVAHLPQPFRPAQPVAGLVVDEWVEVVPGSEVTTGVSFQYDAPGARPPQVVLLAVAPPDTARWEVESLEQTLLETLELARLRALDPQALGEDVLLQRALPALYVSTNVAGETLSTDFRRAFR